MTRPSRRELERALDDLKATGSWSVGEIMMVDLKLAHDADLSADERRLLEALDRDGEDVVEGGRQEKAIVAEWLESDEFVAEFET